jgi:flagellar biosynthesis protein FlhF
MNVRRFTARTSRDALVLVRQVLGEDAVVLSTKPSVDGVEVLAMAPEGMQQIERMSWNTDPVASAPAPAPEPTAPPPQSPEAAVADDVNTLSMSTLSFQDYVRERMLRRRKAAMKAEAPSEPSARAGGASERASVLEQRMADRVPAPPAGVPPREAPVLRGSLVAPEPYTAFPRPAEPRMSEARSSEARMAEARMAESRITERPAEPRAAEPRIAEYRAPALPDLQPALHSTHAAASPLPTSAGLARRDQEEMMNELRGVRGLIEERFGALAFMEKLNRQPAQARLTQKLLDCGFSPLLIRKIGDSLANDVVDETAWAASVLERNLLTAEAEAPLEDQGGVYALVGATGVGKTTTTAKIAAAFATKYGAANLGLITLDAYRIGAHEQLRAYGRILGVPVHTAHDRASLEDLLDLLAAKKMVLIDTAGMAQRDSRTRELLEMLGHRSIRRLLVVNAASQGETIEDVMVAYDAPQCAGIVLSKMDEAVKLGPALDALIRMKLKLLGVANGQRVPEDWHRLSANALVHRALRGGGSAAYRLDAGELSLVFTAPLGRGSNTPPLHA